MISFNTNVVETHAITLPLKLEVVNKSPTEHQLSYPFKHAKEEK